MFVNWKEVWEEYSNWWWEANKKDYCPECGQNTVNPPSWEEQQACIEEAVERNLLRNTEKMLPFAGREVPDYPDTSPKSLEDGEEV
jgi:hypothetical protein